MNLSVNNSLVNGLYTSKAPQGVQKHVFTAHKWHILLALLAGLAIGAGVMFALLQFTPPIEPVPQDDISTIEGDAPWMYWEGVYEFEA